jgi:hypothetical protein
MSLDDMFKHPERTNLSDAQFDRLLDQREKEKRLRAGLIGFSVALGSLAAVAVALIIALSGVFGA